MWACMSKHVDMALGLLAAHGTSALPEAGGRGICLDLNQVDLWGYSGAVL